MGKELSSNNLRIAKEQQIINELRYTKVELKNVSKVKRKKDSIKFQRDQKILFKKLEGA